MWRKPVISPLTALSPEAVHERLRQGHALLVDIREADEFARRHVSGALSLPLSKFGTAPLPVVAGANVIFTCRTGMRTANCGILAAPVTGTAYVLDGGIDAWAAAGFPVEANARAPLEMMRQVQIVAGLLVLLGVVLGFLVRPEFYGLAAFVGAGLTMAGITGFCGMARLLAFLPWNRPTLV